MNLKSLLSYLIYKNIHNTYQDKYFLFDFPKSTT